MTSEEIKAALERHQAKGKIEPDSIRVLPFVENDGRLLVSFLCESYANAMYDIEKLYTIELGYVQATINSRAIIGLLLTPKTANQ